MQYTAPLDLRSRAEANLALPKLVVDLSPTVIQQFQHSFIKHIYDNPRSKHTLFILISSLPLFDRFATIGIGNIEAIKKEKKQKKKCLKKFAASKQQNSHAVARTV